MLINIANVVNKTPNPTTFILLILFSIFNESSIAPKIAVNNIENDDTAIFEYNNGALESVTTFFLRNFEEPKTFSSSSFLSFFQFFHTMN